MQRYLVFPFIIFILTPAIFMEKDAENENVNAVKSEKMQTSNYDTATFGGGCFWCTEAIFTRLEGVIGVKPGYSGGVTENPTYKEVCTGNTGHAEVIQIEFDPAKVTYYDLLEVFFKTHDPTTLNRQGVDSGTQYRSVVLFHSESQKQEALKAIQELNSEKIWDSPIVTEVVPFEKFYPAEDYHHNYFKYNSNQGYCQMVVMPKVEKFEKLFKEKLKKK